jgi:pSer/pThr/pTyr-binding forkhead associated (FHA) protein
MEVQLVMFTEAGERREFDLKRTVSIIGRAGDCDFQIPLPMISRRHCQITRKSDRVLVKDLGSSNGSYINNKRVLQAEVHGGDILTVGPVVFTILIDGKPTDIKAIPSIVKPAAEPTAGAPAATADDSSTGDSPIDLIADATTPPASSDGSSIDFAGLDHIEITDDTTPGGSGDSSVASPLAELEALAKQQKK